MAMVQVNGGVSFVLQERYRWLSGLDDLCQDVHYLGPMIIRNVDDGPCT